MTQEKILQKLQDIIMPYLENPCEIKMESNLSKDLAINSVDFVSIITEIEDNFQCNMADEQIEKIRIVQDFVYYIMSRMSNNN